MTDIFNKIDSLQEKINNYRPLAKEELSQLKNYYKIGLTYSSNAIEGNSLTEIETKVVIEDGLTIGGKRVKDHLEAIGHSHAFDFIYDILKNPSITEADILNIHRLFYSGIDDSNAGKYRSVSVVISGSSRAFPKPSSVPKLMSQFINNIPSIKEHYHPVEYAALVHYHFVDIHPFIDGNGRTARLLMNLCLLKHGYPITIIPPIRRAEYIECLQTAETNNLHPFTQFISECVYESQKDYLRLFQND